MRKSAECSDAAEVQSTVGSILPCACCERKWRHYKMRNSKHKLLPYEVIEKAVAGEPEAIHKVVRHYTGYIKYLSFFQGRYNDDLQEQLEAHLIGALFRFRFDK